MAAQYYYFKPNGKWKYEGEGKSIPNDGRQVTHDSLWELNGCYPGISTNQENGRYFTVVVIDDESFPRLVLSKHLQMEPEI